MALTDPPVTSAARPAMTIRAHLLLLALCAVVPLIAFAFYVSVLLIDKGREAIRIGAQDRVRALMTAVDAEVNGSITTLLAIATSRSLAEGDLKAFHEEIVRVRASQPSWASITLIRPSDGKQLVNSARPFGTDLPVNGHPESVKRLLSTRLPVVGGVTPGPVLGIHLIPMRAPVVIGGKVQYIVTAGVRPESFEELIRKQSLPAGWVIGLVDAEGRFIARVPTRAVGTVASPNFREQMNKAPEGWYRGRTVEGLDTYTAFNRSSVTGWAIGFAIPETYVAAGERGTAWTLGIGALVSLMMALLIAYLIGRHIAEPISALAETARNIGSGAPPRPATVGRVSEVVEVAEALDQAAGAVRERQRLIEREKAVLLESDQAKDQFIAMLSHELRNPLSALTAAAHLLKLSGPEGKPAEHARGVIERQTRHMTRLIEDLLDINRVVMGKATLVREALDLGDLVSEFVRTWRASGRLANHVVTVEVARVMIDADRSRVEQVFSNLLENALKFTPRGRRIAVSVTREGGEAVLRVEDEGEGLAPGMADKVFGLFVQGPQALDRQNGGLGVGLALVKGLLELHGGSVSASSAGPGQGTTMVARFPALEAEPVSPAPTATNPGIAGRSRSILIVEDNEDARQMLRVMLELTGNRVRDAADGMTGLRMAAKEVPDVMLVDIGLPDLNGYEVAARVRAAPWGGGVLLIALTGYGQAEDKRRALEAGFDAHATKPVLPEQLATLMETAGRPLESRAG